MAPNRMTDFVTGHTSNTRIGLSEAEQERNRVAKAARVKPPSLGISRAQANTPQARENENRHAILMQGAHDGKIDMFGTEYAGSTTASRTPSRVQVEDSQLNAQGVPVGHPDHQIEDDFEDDDGFEEESLEGGSEAEESDPNGSAAITRQIARSNRPGFADRYQQGDSYPDTSPGRPYDAEHTNSVFIQAAEHYLSPAEYAAMQRDLNMPQSDNRAAAQKLPRAQAEFQRQQHANFGNQTSNKPLQAITTQKSITHRHQASQPATQRAAIQNQTGHASQPAKERTNSANVNQLRPHAAPYQMPTPQQTDPREEEAPYIHFDHDEEVLRKMSYDDLRKEPFDFSPVNPTPVLSEADSAQPLTERMQIVQSLGIEQKHAFLSSLPLDEWEDAGDWFLERFGAIIGKMRDARKQRRKLANEYEDEITKRHEQVQSKKRDIDEAIGEMGRSGQDVLRASTPKRHKM